ncbi:MAG: SAM-dependent methyltransferase, partial [Prochlorococcaceae cyanobacterium]
ADGEGLRLGRDLLASLPERNRLRRHHEQRWALDTAADANFADMYLHPQESSYNLDRLFDFVAAAELQFAGFSNPQVWDPARLLAGELLERARALTEREQWQLVEALDPDISHFEFFLSKGELATADWSRDQAVLAARAQRNPCLWGWPGSSLLGPDLEPINLEPEGVALLQAIDAAGTDTSLGALGLGWAPELLAAVARELVSRQLLLLRP